MRWSTICAALLWTVVSVSPTYAQKPVQTPTANATCTFADRKQMSVRYRPLLGGRKNKLPAGQVWASGDSPMYLFTQADLSLGGYAIPIGAYSMYIIPDKDHWTLVLNKNVREGSVYQEAQDLLRVPMQIGDLSRAENFRVYFGHVAPKQCNMRIYYGKTGSWVEFREK